MVGWTLEADAPVNQSNATLEAWKKSGQLRPEQEIAVDAELKKRGVTQVTQRETAVAEKEKAIDAKEARSKDVKLNLEQAIKFGESQIGTGSLGRLQKGQGDINTKLGRAETNLDRLKTEVGPGREADLQQIIDERRKLLGGLSDEETNIMRSRAEKEIARTEETQRRRLQAIQNITGVRGGTAASQQLQVLQQGQAQRTAFEQNMIMANREAQMAALSGFENAVLNANQANLQRTSMQLQVEQGNIAQQLRERELQQFNLAQELQERQLQQFNTQKNISIDQFNLAQAARERFGQISLGTGLMGMQLGTEANLQAQKTQAEATAAYNNSASSGGSIPLLGGLIKFGF